MVDCVFCKIVTGEIPSYKVYEDEGVFAFLDIKPHAKGHTVLIPKKHGVSAFDFEDDVLREVIVGVKRVLERVKEVLQPDGFNVGWNDGTAAGQVVPHLHVHVMPRWNGDGGGSMHSIIKNPGEMSVDEIAKLFE